MRKIIFLIFIGTILFCLSFLLNNFFKSNREFSWTKYIPRIERTRQRMQSLPIEKRNKVYFYTNVTIVIILVIMYFRLENF